ncbi:hypothetical protein [Nocardia altamirensis]|uniref:hypothetical protein n=1 Tax=Nocardia altamirensis TaxID=472158 RepID=UPI00084062E1|nr:hypothetical protein [Nocardia altamirensis]
MTGINRAVSALSDATVQITTAMTDRFGGALVHLYRDHVSVRVKSALHVVGDVDGPSASYQRAAEDWYRNPAMATAALHVTTPPTANFDWFDGSSAASINREIDDSLHRVNPRYNEHDPRWANNCISVANAHELRRRGFDVEAGPVAEKLPDGFYHVQTTLAWGQEFTRVDMNGLRHMFREPGARGILLTDDHELNVENVPGVGLRFVDGQPNPPLTDATHLVRRVESVWAMRVDNVLGIPSRSILEDLGIRFVDSAERQ